MGHPSSGPGPALRRLQIIWRISLGRSFRNQSSNDMALPHPQSRKDHYRNEEKPSWRGVTENFLKRTVDVAEDRNGKDKVNPANNRTFGGVLHDEYDLLDSRFQLAPSFHGFSRRYRRCGRQCWKRSPRGRAKRTWHPRSLAEAGFSTPHTAPSPTPATSANRSRHHP
jgi:hypothetical protein